MIARGGEEVQLGGENSKMLHDWDKVRQSPTFRKGFTKSQGSSD